MKTSKNKDTKKIWIIALAVIIAILVISNLFLAYLWINTSAMYAEQTLVSAQWCESTWSAVEEMNAAFNWLRYYDAEKFAELQNYEINRELCPESLIIIE